MLYGLRKYKKQIEGDKEIAKELQDGNKSALILRSLRQHGTPEKDKNELRPGIGAYASPTSRDIIREKPRAKVRTPQLE